MIGGLASGAASNHGAPSRSVACLAVRTNPAYL